VAVDDFGTGYSSLSYLKRFDIDTLKIDGSFVAELPDDPEDRAIATAIVAMGHSLQMRVVAEKVETAEQAECLRAMGCDAMQGYLLSRPLAAGPLRTWLKARHRGAVAPGRAADEPITVLDMDRLDFDRATEPSPGP
jgi:EAL domain-containing protein (putative c-di-GMP-specific phosphodiesterase class I)